ncbi:MAG: MEDS domain-containing protein [Acidobacteriota bacterium]
MKALRILIADDHAVVRRSLRSLLESHPGCTVSEAANGREAVEQTRRLEPDIVLLDMTMPELNGLEATRQILKEAPGTPVLILTVHESDELADEVRRAGGRGMIDKYRAHETLIAAIESLVGSKAPIHLAGSVVGRARHIAAFFSSDAERDRVLAPFIAEGLEQGEKALHFIDPSDRDLHVRRLREAGVNIERAEEQGQVQLVPWEKITLRGGYFDQEAMLTRIQEVLSDGAAKGFPLTRLVAHMEWALEDRPGVEDLVEFEARLNYVLPKFDDVVICAYDLTKFKGDIIAGALRSHPAVVFGGALRENPFYELGH